MGSGTGGYSNNSSNEDVVGSGCVRDRHKGLFWTISRSKDELSQKQEQTQNWLNTQDELTSDQRASLPGMIEEVIKATSVHYVTSASDKIHRYVTGEILDSNPQDVKDIIEKLSNPDDATLQALRLVAVNAKSYGKREGREEGYEDGCEAGYEAGRKHGYDKGKERGGLLTAAIAAGLFVCYWLTQNKADTTNDKTTTSQVAPSQSKSVFQPK